MLKLIPSILLTACMTLAASAQAGTTVLEPIIKPLDPALIALDSDGKSKFEVRELSMRAADTLLDSTEGPAWKVLSVQGPACVNPATKEKVERKNCQALKADCKAAEGYAVQFGKHAVCSALYTQTTVLLTNDGPGAKRIVPAAKPVKPKAVKHSRKHPQNTEPVVHKKAATSC